MVLSPDQQTAHDAIVAWYDEHKRPLLTMGGLAGSGKTTLAAKVAATLRSKHKGLRIAFVCFAGKAAFVLRSKLERAGALKEGEHCGTIHSLIYHREETIERGLTVVSWNKREEIPADLIFLDEASMVDKPLLDDLMSYGKPILAMGDHGQLPPVNGAFNLMAAPELRLEKIHRQAEGNPIIRLAMMARNGERIAPGEYGPGVMKVQSLAAFEQVKDPAGCMVICGTNRTRVSLNKRIRARLGITNPVPQPGEKIMCLRNNRKAGVFNGMPGLVRSCEPIANKPHLYKLIAAMDGLDDLFSGAVLRAQFGSEKLVEVSDRGLDGERYDFSYAITAHKSQGSEQARVVVFEECDWMKDEDLKRRWRYTSYTRASEKLLIIGK